jgi:glycosidase
MNVPSLPELQLEEKEVQDYIYQKKESVIQSYLYLGIDGWRLDVAFDIGYQYLKEITDAAHRVNPLNAVIGEIPNYPKLWLKSLDGVMNFSFREIILRLLKQTISMPFAQHVLSRIIKDAGIEGILKSWIVIDNHDVPRLNHELITLSQQQLAWVLLMTLPGSPNVYYGSELGMTGGDDPENRAPMDWSLVHDENDTFNFVRSLIALRKQSVALKVGDYMDLVSDRLFGFIRFTEHVDETRIVIMNTSDETIHTHMLMPMSDIMHFSKFDILHGSVEFIHVTASILEVKLAPGSYVICQPHTSVDQSYTAYKRVNKI